MNYSHNGSGSRPLTEPNAHPTLEQLLRLDDRTSFELQQAIIARAHAERAAYMMALIGRVPALLRRLFARKRDAKAAGKVGVGKAVATAYGARC